MSKYNQISPDKIVWTKQSFRKNQYRQNSPDDLVRTTYTVKVSPDKIVWTQQSGQNNQDKNFRNCPDQFKYSISIEMKLSKFYFRSDQKRSEPI